MNQGLIPRRYAKALYKFALEKCKQLRVYALMSKLEESYRLEPELQKVMSNPFIPAQDKRKLLCTASDMKDDDSVMADFLTLLTRNGRVDMMRDIALAYLDIYRQENNIHVVKVTSASPMSEADEQRLKSLIEKHLDGATMEYSSAVDPSLIGGFSVEVGNERIDASISNELKQLRLNLLSK